MRIKRLEIYGYGKWVDQSFDLARDVQLFYGVNEAGKSTLMSFIHSILFGFPTRNSTLLRYEPQESSKYGGKIIAQDVRFGEVIIERVHGKVTGNVTVTLEDGATGTDELLETVLAGMTRETFQNIFSFSLSDIENVHHLNKNQLSRYLLNIGAHGTDYYLDLVDEFRKDADKLYRPTGRVLPLNRQLAALEKQEQRLADLEARNESYLDLIEENNRQLNEIEQLEKKQKQFEKRLADVVEFKKEWHVFEEIKELQATIRKTNIPPLKEDGHYLFEEYKKDLSKINEELQEANLAVNAQKEVLANPEMMEHYEKYQTEILELEQTLPEIIEQLGEFQVISNQRAENQKSLTVLEQQLKLEHSSSYPTAFLEEEKEKVDEWLTSFADLEEKSATIQTEIQTLENELNLKNQQLDQIEAVMWDNETLRNVELELEAGETPAEKPKKTTTRPTIISGAVGALLLSAAFLTNPPLQWLLFGIGLLALISAVFLFSKRNQKTTTSDKQPSAFMTQEYEKQLSLKDQWRDALGEIDSIQARYQERIVLRDSHLNEQKAIEENWGALLQEHKLPEELLFVNAKNIMEQTNNLQALLDADHKLLEAHTTLRKELADKTNAISNILDIADNATFSEKVHHFRTYLTNLKSVLNEEESKIEKLSALRQEVKQLTTNKQNTKDKMNTLIETAGAKDEADFFDLYKQKEILDAKKSRLAFLKENAPSFNEEKELPTKEALNKKEEDLREELQKLADENKKAVRELANTQLSIEHLEKDGTYTEELQQFENQKATAQRLVDEWVSSKIAAGMIQETLSQVTQDRFEEIIFDAETYFHLLTNEEYEKIVFKEEELFVQHQNGHVMDVKVLSRGTAEPLYVAIRLAYIKNTQDMIELPIIMDDPFVNFDRTRQQNMYELMQRLGHDLQIIYFTFDPTVRDYFDRNQITKLNEF